MRIRLIKNRSDIGAGTRGSDMGIDAIEIAAINQGDDYFNKYPYTDVDTHNETVYDKVQNTFAKRLGFVKEQCRRVSDTVKDCLSNGEFPIVLSGDHSSALGTISGVKSAIGKKRLGVIWIDAHADLHSPYTSPSGNVHGMPLSAATGIDNLDFKVNEVTDNTVKDWTSIKNIGIDGPKVKASDIIFFGVRSVEEAELGMIQNEKIRNYPVHEVRLRSAKECVEEALGNLTDCDAIYITFDVDSMDCDMVSRGTGTPVPKGFDPYEVLDIIQGILASNKVVCLEVSEVNPLLDLKGNVMAETAFNVLNVVTQNIEKLELPL